MNKELRTTTGNVSRTNRLCLRSSRFSCASSRIPPDSLICSSGTGRTRSAPLPRAPQRETNFACLTDQESPCIDREIAASEPVRIHSPQGAKEGLPSLRLTQKYSRPKGRFGWIQDAQPFPLHHDKRLFRPEEEVEALPFLLRKPLEPVLLRFPRPLGLQTGSSFGLPLRAGIEHAPCTGTCRRTAARPPPRSGGSRA